MERLKEFINTNQNKAQITNDANTQALIKNMWLRTNHIGGCTIAVNNNKLYDFDIQANSTAKLDNENLLVDQNSILDIEIKLKEFLDTRIGSFSEYQYNNSGLTGAQFEDGDYVFMSHYSSDSSKIIFTIDSNFSKIAEFVAVPANVDTASNSGVVVPLKNGNILVCFTDRASTGYPQYRIFDKNGNLITDSTTITSNYTNSSAIDYVVVDNVAYVLYRATNGNVFVAKFDTTGNLLDVIYIGGEDIKSIKYDEGRFYIVRKNGVVDIYSKAFNSITQFTVPVSNSYGYLDITFVGDNIAIFYLDSNNNLQYYAIDKNTFNTTQATTQIGGNFPYIYSPQKTKYTHGIFFVADGYGVYMYVINQDLTYSNKQVYYYGSSNQQWVSDVFDCNDNGVGVLFDRYSNTLEIDIYGITDFECFMKVDGVEVTNA